MVTLFGRAHGNQSVNRYLKFDSMRRLTVQNIEPQAIFSILTDYMLLFRLQPWALVHCSLPQGAT
jgi:hypothetical protein